ncbi:MAG: M20/M25/M40 family metallo-hydrolase [Gemmatimonadales bacterium]|nr:M20/M25/M40 family metallo-hydrolase [Gemmatimonadales bacterium]
MRIATAAFLVTTLLRPPAGMAQAPTTPLDQIERSILRHVDDHNAEALALLEKVVNINSGTMNFAGVRAVGAIFRAELDALGFTTRWEEGAPYGRAGHLIAERGTTGPRILLIGHLDTVFEPDHPLQRFERLDSNRARGPGTTDMKGGDVIVVQALKALKAAGALDRMRITVVFHGDEEHTGEPKHLARATLLEAARRSDIAIGFEDGDGDPASAVIARRGIASWLLTSTGTPAHSSQVFREDIGAGAIYETARVLQQFREKLSGDPLLTFNPGLALGGTAVDLDSARVRGGASGKMNIVAERMMVAGDLRTISPERLVYAKNVMRAIVADALPKTRSEISFEDGYPPMAPTDGNRRLLAIYDRVSRDLGFGPIGIDNPARAGAADISFTSGIVPMAIDGLGLGGTGGHTAQETADLSALPMIAKRTAVLLYRLSARPAAP